MCLVDSAIVLDVTRVFSQGHGLVEDNDAMRCERGRGRGQKGEVALGFRVRACRSLCEQDAPVPPAMSRVAGIADEGSSHNFDV